MSKLHSPNSINNIDDINNLDIAIIGISCRFPGAKDINAFWENLRDGVESISFFSEQELISSGIELALLSNPNYVRAGALLSDIEWFDASFFGFSPREAEIIDPQHRLFLECAWEAFESAGYDTQTYDGSIGVYAGAGMNTYLLNNLYPHLAFSDLAAIYQVMISNDKDFLSTLASYKLNLKGPSVNVQTACSTSLVAIHLACQSLLNGECDMALAGGVSILFQQKAGYLYQEGMILSPDGHCRAFDAQAQGTVSGNGIGLVILKPLADAIADGDCIHAIIKGSAINNDGSLKVGYTAPSVDGQAAVISEAMAVAGIEAKTITYVEAHGTGTALGDPIEIAALTQAFRASTQNKGFCAVGSVKTNLGHLDTAAGMAGLIKTVQALKHKLLPPSLHFEQPNPKIAFANSPFYVNTTLSEWKTDRTPRRAGVSSFGIGGTNAHIVMEEAPRDQPSGKSRPWQLVLLSAKTSSALDTTTANLAKHLKQHPQINLADFAYTLSNGRRAFSHRRMLVCQDSDQAAIALETLDVQQVFTNFQESKERPVAFMFSGQGTQYVNMALELYQSEPTFREQLDLCSELLKSHLKLDLRHVLYPSEARVEEVAQQLKQTSITQPALFAIEYALAKLWMSWGLRPQAMIGHSIGEYVAACLAGVFSLEDALWLVAARGKLIQQLPSGRMLAVQLPAKEVEPLLGKELSLAVINEPSQCVVSGLTNAVEELENRLAKQGVECRQLHTSHAFHSEMMAPILQPFTEQVKKVSLKPPQIPYLSNVTGTWITTAQATDPSYWAKHLRQTVRFAEGVQQLLKEPERILLEIGPGQTLRTLALRHPDKVAQLVLSSLRHPQDHQSDVALLLTTLGKLWLAGVQVDWSGFYAHERRHRLSLPTYPFERQRYWIEIPKKQDAVNTALKALPATSLPHKKLDIADWFYIPSWKRSLLPARQPSKQPICSCTLVFIDECGLGSQLVKKLNLEGQDVITVKVGAEFTQLSDRLYTLNPQVGNDYTSLINELLATNKRLKTIFHLWSITSPNTTSGLESINKAQDLGFYSLLFLTQALGKQSFTDQLQILVVSNNVQEVTGEEVVCPEKATILGPCKVIPQEYTNISCRSIDIVVPKSGSRTEQKLIDQLLDELQAKSGDLVIAYRGKHRWVQSFEPMRLDKSGEATSRLREEGVYLIIGGLGDIGLVIAKHLAKTVRAKLILTGRSDFPAREEWKQWLASHDEHDSVSRKIRQVQELEDWGAQVLVVSADVANQQQMQAAIAKIQKQFGVIHGVIHAAGIIAQKTFHAIGETGKTECEQEFQAKIHGLLVLKIVLREIELDFVLLISSLSSVLGGLGFVAYSATNLFMDAFTYQHNQTSPFPWISINWDAWQFGKQNKQSTSVEASLVEFAIAPEEGAKALQLILSCREINQVFVSTRNLQTRIDQWIKIESLQESDNFNTEGLSSLYLRPNLPNSYVAPHNEIEQAIADIWQQLLGIEQVGIYDNFFELGGHSLLASRVISRVRGAFQVELPLRSLFEVPIIAELAKVIEKLKHNNTKLQSPAIVPVFRILENSFAATEKTFDTAKENVFVFPASFAQARLWFLDQLEGKSVTYNEVGAWKIKGLLQVDALKQTIAEIVRRHEVLRTTFSVVNGSPVQVIDPTPSMTLPVVDLQTLSEGEKSAKMRQLTTEEAQRPFELSKGPLLRVTLLKLSEEEHILLGVLHHIVSDGWSIGIFIRELSTLYEAFSKGAPSPLPELPVQYADFAVWQRQWLSGEGLETLLNYWKQQLAGTPPVLELPTDYPRPPIQTFRVSTLQFQINQELTQKLKILSQQSGATLFMALLAAFATLLSRYSNQEDIVIGSPIANRNRSEIEPLIGIFVNTLVLRIDLSSNPTFRELLYRVREVTLEAYEHQYLPFEKLVEELKPERALSRNPLFQVWFALQNTPLKELDIPGLTLHPLAIESGMAPFDLVLLVEEKSECLNGSFRYSTDLFNSTTVARILKHFQSLLGTIVAEPDQRLRSLSLLTIAEAGGYTPSDFPDADLSQHDFENLLAQISREPELE